MTDYSGLQKQLKETGLVRPEWEVRAFNAPGLHVYRAPGGYKMGGDSVSLSFDSAQRMTSFHVRSKDPDKYDALTKTLEAVHAQDAKQHQQARQTAARMRP